MVNIYGEIGRLRVGDEQQGKAAYGKVILKTLSKQLTLEFARPLMKLGVKYLTCFLGFTPASRE